MANLPSIRAVLATAGIKGALPASLLVFASATASAGAPAAGQQDATNALAQYTGELAGAEAISASEMQTVRGGQRGYRGRTFFLRTLELIDNNHGHTLSPSKVGPPGSNGPGLDYSQTDAANPDNLRPGTCNVAGICAGYDDRDFLSEAIEYRIEQCTGLGGPDYCETQFGF